MKAKIIVEGREFEVDINDPELQKLLEPQPKHTGYERVAKGGWYYIANLCATASDIDDRQPYNDDMYENANYYSDLDIAKNNLRADKLMRQLRRFAVEHRESSVDWQSAHRSKYYIDYNHGKSIFDIFSNEIYQALGVVYFDSKKTAELAIETFHDELIWYFTEYQDSL